MCTPLGGAAAAAWWVGPLPSQRTQPRRHPFVHVCAHKSLMPVMGPQLATCNSVDAQDTHSLADAYWQERLHGAAEASSQRVTEQAVRGGNTRGGHTPLLPAPGIAACPTRPAGALSILHPAVPHCPTFSTPVGTSAQPQRRPGPPPSSHRAPRGGLPPDLSASSSALLRIRDASQQCGAARGPHPSLWINVQSPQSPQSYAPRSPPRHATRGRQAQQPPTINHRRDSSSRTMTGGFRSTHPVSPRPRSAWQGVRVLGCWHPPTGSTDEWKTPLRTSRYDKRAEGQI